MKSGLGGSALKEPLEQLDVLADSAVALAQSLDHADRVHHGRMVPPTEFAADFGQRAGGQLLGQIHRHLTWPRHRAGPPLRLHFRELDVVVLGDAALDFFDRNAAIAGAQNIAQYLLGHLDRDCAAD